MAIKPMFNDIDKIMYSKEIRETKEYRIWYAMIGRCTQKGWKVYKNYGARGITVCDRWKESFYNFLEDMGHKPENMSLDRINNNGNYEPSNCRWATFKQQSRNSRRNRNFIINGEVKCLTDWAFTYNKNIHDVYKFLNEGHEIKEALHLSRDRLL